MTLLRWLRWDKYTLFFNAMLVLIVAAMSYFKHDEPTLEAWAITFGVNMLWCLPIFLFAGRDGSDKTPAASTAEPRTQS